MPGIKNERYRIPKGNQKGTIQRNWQYRTHKTEKNKTKTQHNIWWKPLYTRHKTKKNKTKNTTQYMVETTIYKTQDEEKQNQEHNTIYGGNHYIQAHTNVYILFDMHDEFFE